MNYKSLLSRMAEGADVADFKMLCWKHVQTLRDAMKYNMIMAFWLNCGADDPRIMECRTNRSIMMLWYASL
jgi:hypothetical protein